MSSLKIRHIDSINRDLIDGPCLRVSDLIRALGECDPDAHVRFFTPVPYEDRQETWDDISDITHRGKDTVEIILDTW